MDPVALVPDHYWRVVFRRHLDPLRHTHGPDALVRLYLLAYRVGQLAAAGHPRDPLIGYTQEAGRILAERDGLDLVQVAAVIADGLADGGRLPDRPVLDPRPTLGR